MGNDYKKYEEVDYVVELSEDEIHILEFVKVTSLRQLLTS